MLFSVIVPVYNAEQYLNKCVDSIVKQEYEDFEVILINDGSKDQSAQICDAYAKKDRRIQVIHKENGGVVSARAAGIDCAKGEYILFADADDWIDFSLLAELSCVIKDNGAPDTILFDAYKVYENRQELMDQSLVPGMYDRKRMEKEILPFMMYDPKRPFLCAMIAGQLWNKAIKRDIITEHFCREESIYKAEDFACIYECIYFSKTFYYLNKPLYFYNKMNENSAMTKYDKTYFRNHEKVITYVSEHLGTKSEILKKQIAAVNVSGICIGVFHEMRHNRGLWEARNHIKQELEETTSVKIANCAGLPLHAKIYIFLLRHKLYFISLLSAKIYLRLTGT